MNDRGKKIAMAALRAYEIKGVRRTTMTDIASEAGVTRQTVYNAFANTDAVLRAAIRFFIDEKWQQIVAEWAHVETLSQKLDILLFNFAIEPWDFIHKSTQASELAGGYNEAGRAEIEAARLGFRHDIAALYMPWEDKLIAQGTNPLAVADFISAAIEGVKYNNATKADILLAVATLKASLMALTK